MEEMAIVDTTVWVDFFGGVVNAHTTWLRSALGNRPIGLVGLVLCEVLQGVRDDATFTRVNKTLTTLSIFSADAETVAVASAQNYRALRRRGLTVRKTVDCIIATFCIHNGHMLLHHDRDFDAFEKHLGLRVVHPPAGVQ